MIHRLTRYALAALFAAALTSAPAVAKKPTAKNRQIHQQKRIKQGAKSGALTRAETRRLERNAARIHVSTAKDRRDGGAFTPAERVEAQRKLNRQSRAIHKQKTDDDQR